jgi:sugar phosphate isomerase/epimerase
MMKLSMMSMTMSRHPDFDVKKMLELTRELELDGIDFITLHDHDPGDLRKMTDDYGIPVICYTYPVALNFSTPQERDEGLDAFRKGLDAAHILGAPIVMIPPAGNPDIDRNISRQNWIAGLQEAMPFARDAGLTLTIETYPGPDSPFVTADDFFALKSAIPEVKLTFDNANTATGEDPVEALKRCIDDVVHVHFKDWNISECRKAEGFKEMLDGRFYQNALIGEGDLDQKGCLKVLKDSAYQGYINLEYLAYNYSGAEATRRAAAYLRELDAAL